MEVKTQSGVNLMKKKLNNKEEGINQESGCFQIKAKNSCKS